MPSGEPQNVSSTMSDFETVRALLHRNISWTFPEQDEAIAALDRIEAEANLTRDRLERADSLYADWCNAEAGARSGEAEVLAGELGAVLRAALKGGGE